MRHLQPSPLKPALDIETFICFRAVQYRLVTPRILRHIVQSLYDPQPELLALLVLSHGNVLNMADETEVVYATVRKQSALLNMAGTA